jgi:hypothetical protein
MCTHNEVNVYCDEVSHKHVCPTCSHTWTTECLEKGALPRIWENFEPTELSMDM